MAIVPTFQMGPAIPEVWNDLLLGEQGNELVSSVQVCPT